MQPVLFLCPGLVGIRWVSVPPYDTRMNLKDLRAEGYVYLPSWFICREPRAPLLQKYQYLLDEKALVENETMFRARSGRYNRCSWPTLGCQWQRHRDS
jgi:hypothetical protein